MRYVFGGVGGGFIIYMIDEERAPAINREIPLTRPEHLIRIFWVLKEFWLPFLFPYSPKGVESP